MMKFLKEMWKTFISAQKEMAEMGIWYIPTSTSFFSYFDEKQYNRYLKQKETIDDDT